MSDVFKHLFNGWHEANARRWKNPDGSEGGIVAVSATVDPSVTLPVTVEVWPNAKITAGVASIGSRASIGYGASIGSRASIGYGASIGSRASIGDGASIGYGASIGSRASIGYGASIGSRASIGYGASIGSRASIGYGASIGDGASIGTRASIGDGASIGYGASIGSRASIGYGESIGSRASIGDGASIGSRASIGDGASYDDGDWLFVAGPQGTRNAWATAIWSPKHGLRWWVGCQHGITTDALRERVERDHGASDHGDDYRHLIQTVETHPGLARAMAAHTASKAAE